MLFYVYIFYLYRQSGIFPFILMVKSTVNAYCEADIKNILY